MLFAIEGFSATHRIFMAVATVAIPSVVQPFRADSLRAGRLRKLHSPVSLEILFSTLRSSDFVSLYTCHSGHSYLKSSTSRTSVERTSIDRAEGRRAQAIYFRHVESNSAERTSPTVRNRFCLNACLCALRRLDSLLP